MRLRDRALARRLRGGLLERSRTLAAAARRSAALRADALAGRPRAERTAREDEPDLPRLPRRRAHLLGPRDAAPRRGGRAREVRRARPALRALRGRAAER